VYHNTSVRDVHFYFVSTDIHKVCWIASFYIFLLAVPTWRCPRFSLSGLSKIIYKYIFIIFILTRNKYSVTMGNYTIFLIKLQNSCLSHPRIIGDINIYLTTFLRSRRISMLNFKSISWIV